MSQMKLGWAVLAVALCNGVQAGETTNRLGITMVDIPAGEFVMGSCKLTSEQQEENKKRAFIGAAPLRVNCLAGGPDGEVGDDEAPQHRVRVKAFKMGKTEVTLGQFKQFIAAENRTDLVNDEFMKYNRFGDDAPVVQVSWNDAQDFIAWLNKTDGKGWRLPSEAEWEYACRAGQRDTYCGSDNVHDVAWFEDNSGKRQQAVGQKRANAWGLHDMSGNVWEWVQDCWHQSYTGAPVDGSAWTGGCYTFSDGSSGRGLRGGSWINVARSTRAAYRIINTPGSRDYYGGFRLARTR